jgi:hypothetical protein
VNTPAATGHGAPPRPTRHSRAPPALRTSTGDTATSTPTETAVRADGASLDQAGTGQIAAAPVAAGVACAAFGLAVVLSEFIEMISAALTLSSAVGPLSGKAVAAVVIYIIVWSACHLAWRHKQVELVRVFRWPGALALVGLLATFPPSTVSSPVSDLERPMFTANQLFLILHIAVGVVFLHAVAGGLCPPFSTSETAGSPGRSRSQA